VPAVGPAHELELLDQVPPTVVVVAVGLRVQTALEVRHHEDPASEDEQLGPGRGAQPGREVGHGLGRNAGNTA
jgi:hypothetical protein